MTKLLIRDQKIAMKFWRHVDVPVLSQDDCWLWTGATDGVHGYGRFMMRGKNTSAQRVAWMLIYGPIPDGLYVCHKCDTPGCVRPSHLFIGTSRDNMLDAQAKGRPIGAKPKLQPLQVDIIRHLHARGVTKVSLAKEFQVEPGTIRRAIRRQNVYADGG